MPTRHVRDVPASTVAAGRRTTMQVLIAPEEGPHFAMRRFAMEPGGSMPLHTNAFEHEQYVLEGRARVRIGDDVHEVEPGSVVFIPAGVPHDYEVLGDDRFVFLCLVPSFADEIALCDD